MTASQLGASTLRCGSCRARVPFADLGPDGNTFTCRDGDACAFRARLRTDPDVWEGLRGLTVWQPWTFAIALGKSPENRSRNLAYRGAVAIHAGLEVDWTPLGDLNDTRVRVWKRFLGLGGFIALWDARPQTAATGYPLMARGAVIAVAELYGTHRVGEHATGCEGTGRACTPWAAMAPGAWHWQLRGVVPLAQPIATRGNQLVWELPADATAAIRGQLARAAV